MSLIPKTNNVIVLNKCHISYETFEKLMREPEENNIGVSVYQRFDESGNVNAMYVYFTADDRMEARYKSAHQDLLNYMALARDFDAGVIIFTEDGPVLPYLDINASPIIKNGGKRLKSKRMVTVSMDRLNEESERWLLDAKLDNYPFRAYPKQGGHDSERFGIYLHIHNKSSNLAMPPQVRKCFEEAVLNGIDIICFDVDAE